MLRRLSISFVSKFSYCISYFFTRAIKFCARLADSQYQQPRPTLIAIESGIKGWDLIEYKELILCAKEYLGADSVVKVQISDNRLYLKEIVAQIGKEPITHYFFDPRTCRQTTISGTWDVLRLSIYLSRKGITPIARLTDVPNRFWRSVCSLLTASSGICITLMCPKDIGHLFPHKRIYGPFMMPFSKQTFDELSMLENDDRTAPIGSSVRFVGSLYEPRTTFLMALKSLLSSDGVDLSIKGRVLGEDRTTDLDYWRAIKASPLFLTTSDQVIGEGMDPFDIPHFIYRYTEALVCGVPLLATYSPGSWKYFRPNEDYFPFSSLAEAHSTIKTILADPEMAHLIAKSGYDRAQSLISDSTFWRTIDLILGEDGFTRQEDLFSSYQLN
jgi:hypothetical protein